MRRIAVLGLGRSGLAIARAAQVAGDHPIVFDESPRPPKTEVVEEARALGIDVRLGYVPPGHWFAFDDDQPPDVVVTNPAVRKEHLGLQAMVRDGVEVIGEIEYAYRISQAPIVAITGSNGKSTTTVWTYQILRHCGIDAVLCGNIFGSGFPEVPLTEAALSARPDQVLVAEVSSFQLEWVSLFRPIAAAITNISSDHLDRHCSQEAYADTKWRLFATQGPDDVAVLGSDGLEARGDRSYLRVSELEGAAVTVRDRDLALLGEVVRGEDLPFRGRHNLHNAGVAALLAQAVLDRRGDAFRPDPAIIAGLKTLKGLSYRMEPVGERDGIEIIDNSMCTNPEAVVVSAQSLTGHLHLLIGGVNKGLDFAPLRDYLRQSGHAAYLFGTESEELQKMLARSGQTYRTMQEAFKAATDRAKPGETIMLAPGCASTDQFRDFRHRGDVFKAIAMEWLQS